MDGGRRDFFGVDVHGFEDFGDDAFLIVTVVDREIGIDAEVPAIDAQNTYAQRMKSAHKGKCRWLVVSICEKLLDAVFHLAGCLIGEGDHENALWWDLDFGDHVHSAVCERAGFAGTGTGEDQHRACDGCDCFALDRI